MLEQARDFIEIAQRWGIALRRLVPRSQGATRVVAEIQRDLPRGAKITRTDLIRDVLQRAVDEREATRKAKAKR